MRSALARLENVIELHSVCSLLICHAIFDKRVRAMGERAIPSLSHHLVMTTYRLAPLPCLDWQWMIHRTVLVTTKIRLSLCPVSRNPASKSLIR